jgi:hypothetical protein
MFLDSDLTDAECMIVEPMITQHGGHKRSMKAREVVHHFVAGGSGAAREGVSHPGRRSLLAAAKRCW